MGRHGMCGRDGRGKGGLKHIMMMLPGFECPMMLELNTKSKVKKPVSHLSAFPRENRAPIQLSEAYTPEMPAFKLSRDQERFDQQVPFPWDQFDELPQVYSDIPSNPGEIDVNQMDCQSPNSDHNHSLVFPAPSAVQPPDINSVANWNYFDE